MHAVFFGVKRIHIETVRFTRELILHCNLTPARYDMMRVIGVYEHGVSPGTLTWVLGVTAPVVSRMLKSLEALGFLTRERNPRDGRLRIVRITERGRVALTMAIAATVEDDQADAIVARLVTGHTPDVPDSPDAILSLIKTSREEVAAVDAVLGRMRKGLADRAAFHHPWLPVRDRLPPMIFTTVVDGRIRYGDELLALA